MKIRKKIREEIRNLLEKDKDDPCQKGYEMAGMKEKNGEKVPNCIPIEKENKETISEGLYYHLKKDIPIVENIYRYGSKKFFELINETRKLYKEGKIKLNEEDKELIDTDIGKKEKVDGKEVWLDMPMINESEYQGKDVDLNQPMRGGNSKPYKVYVKNDKGNVVKVEFGSSSKVHLNDPEARKNYNSRHGCSEGKHDDKTKPGYWSCRLPRYAKDLGLEYDGSAKWW